MGEGQGPTPWLFSSTKRPIHEKKGGEATTTLFFSCWVGFLMTTHVVNCLRAIDETHLYGGLAHNGGNIAKQQLILREKKPE